MPTYGWVEGATIIFGAKVAKSGAVAYAARKVTFNKGGQELNMRIIRRLQHGPRLALQIRLQG